MKFEYILEDKTLKLADEHISDLVSLIPLWFTKWDDERAVQLQDARTIKNCIYQKGSSDSSKWHSQIKLPDMYELAQTLKAHLWENIYSNPAGMFDVSGKTPEAQAYAPTQKTMLVNSFENMNIQAELEKTVNHLIESGDCTLFVGWETRTKAVRRRSTGVSVRTAHPTTCNGFDDGLKPILQAPQGRNDGGSIRNDENGLAEAIGEQMDEVFGGGCESFFVENKTVFDGVQIRAIAPENFVFDRSKRDNWDSCPKIYRSWLTVDEITSNRVFQLDSHSKEDLETLVGQFAQGDVLEGSVNGDKVEILELWGDIRLTDGTMLRNWLITIAGRSAVIRFEPNPYVVNPFIFAALIEDPDTGRGISPLKVALVLNDISSDILNRQLDALSLITNPPYLAPKGSFSGIQEVSPGKIIEYESALMPQAPIPLKFESALQGWEFIRFFKETLESSTGVFKNMMGNTEAQKRTATEINYTVGGQSTRLTMLIDRINQKVIIPMVGRVADLIANFRFGPEVVYAEVKGKVHYIQVDDAVRQADYVYRYGDRRTIQEKKLRFKELYDVISGFSKVDDVANNVNWLECFKYALEQYGIENPDRFLGVVEAGGMSHSRV